MAEDGGMPRERWSGPELLSQLQRFEAALRVAGLRETTVQTYVGRSETFIRWLIGEYTPRGPNTQIEEAGKAREASLGPAMLEDLSTGMAREQIARVLGDYAAVTGYDAALRTLLEASGGRADMSRQTDRVAVLEWLRAWGCRHLRRADTARTADALHEWWVVWEAKLPHPDAAITSLGAAEMLVVEQAYDALASAPAAGRTLKDREVDVMFGDTAAAKTLFAIRPQAFPPWDEPIRLAFGWWGGGAAYVEFLHLAATTLEGLARRLDVSVAQLPQILGRPDSSAAKIIDEFLWIKITRGL